MAIEIVMPRLGWTMEEGTLVEWIKKDGDTVQPGEIMFVIESDKALNEVESFEAGIFRIPPNSDVLGKTLPVGTVLAYVAQPGEALPFEQAPSAVLAAPAQTSAAASSPVPVQQIPVIQTSAAQSSNGSSLPNISPRARRVAHELGIEWAVLKGSGRTGRIVERDVRAAAVSAPQTAAAQVSPVAKRAAEELGVDIHQLAAQMPGQRITREHVERAALPTAPAATTQPTAAETRTPMPRVRQVIAERMSASAQTTAPVTLTTEVDATELVKVRQGLESGW